jgi:hypothetical protein
MMIRKSLKIIYTVIRFVSTSAKFGTCTIAREGKWDTSASVKFTVRDGASAKFSTNSHETDNSVDSNKPLTSGIIIFILTV